MNIDKNRSMIMDGWESDIAEMDAEIKQLKQDCKNLVEVNNNQMDYTKSRDIEIEELKMEDKIIGLTKSIRDHNDELSFGTIRTLEMIDDVSRSHETEIKLLKKRTRKYCDMINDRDAEIEEALETIIEYSSGMFDPIEVIAKEALKEKTNA